MKANSFYIKQLLLGIDVLVNNAGLYKTCPVADMSVGEFRNLIDINLTSPMVMAKECIPHLRKTKGSMLHISSVGGERVRAHPRT